VIVLSFTRSSSTAPPRACTVLSATIRTDPGSVSVAARDSPHALVIAVAASASNSAEKGRSRIDAPTSP
jgi:hypothetical protein